MAEGWSASRWTDSKVLDVPHRLMDHQVDIQKQTAAPADGLDHRDAHRNVGDKDAVHNIYMEVVSAGGLFDVPLQIDVVGGQDGWGDFNHDKLLLCVDRRWGQPRRIG